MNKNEIMLKMKHSTICNTIYKCKTTKLDQHGNAKMFTYNHNIIWYQNNYCSIYGHHNFCDYLVQNA